MKRTLLLMSGAGLAAAAFWSALWYFGQSEVQARFDLHIAQQRAAGTEITWTDRTIGGFPFGYTLRLGQPRVRHAGSGITAEAPAMTVAIEPEALRFAPDGSVVVTLPGALTGADAALTVTIRAPGSAVTVAGADGQASVASLSAPRIEAASGPSDNPLRIVMDTLTARFETAAERSVATIGAGLIETTLPGTDGAAHRVRMETLTASLIAAGAPSPGQRALRGAFQIGQAAVALQGGDTADGAGASARASALTGIFIKPAGGMTADFDAELREVSVVMPGGEAGAPVRAGRADYLQIGLGGPVAASDTFAPGRLRLALGAGAPDAATWATIDPDETLARSGANLVLDIGASVRRLAGRAAAGIPVAFSAVTVREARLDALGATFDAEGEVEILQPVNKPFGEIRMRLANGGPAIAALARAGLLNPETAAMADAILQVYARPGPETDTHVSELVFDSQGRWMNGQPVP